MPFTPYHFGIHAAISIPLRKYIDIPVFILANVAVDIEPLIVILFQPEYPLHGYCHTFLFGSVIGILLAFIMYMSRGVIDTIVSVVHLEYKPRFITLIVSGITGVWLHILCDAPLYTDMKPFFPLENNPFYRLASSFTIYWICRLAFIPAIILGTVAFLTERKKKNNTL
ncbi:MAG: hypothetical protein JXB88_11695 [Spirochaetales bacterium]|nr:hypothetical protein [Spirochaetales bacterium]